MSILTHVRPVAKPHRPSLRFVLPPAPPAVVGDRPSEADDGYLCGRSAAQLDSNSSPAPEWWRSAEYKAHFAAGVAEGRRWAREGIARELGWADALERRFDLDLASEFFDDSERMAYLEAFRGGTKERDAREDAMERDAIEDMVRRAEARQTFEIN